jgi:formate hydrogenlyase subunit 3/multisubunit Na+/H+ antiporter MnhD subunit
MTFFDCVYLKVSKFYSSANNEKLSGFPGLFVVAGMQSLNIFTVFLIICIILQQNPHIPSWSLLLLYIALIFTNGIRYFRIDFSIFQEKWDGIAERKRNRLNRFVSIYIAGSSVVCLILDIYIGGKKF